MALRLKLAHGNVAKRAVERLVFRVSEDKQNFHG